MVTILIRTSSFSSLRTELLLYYHKTRAEEPDFRGDVYPIVKGLTLYGRNVYHISKGLTLLGRNVYPIGKGLTSLGNNVYPTGKGLSL